MRESLRESSGPQGPFRGDDIGVGNGKLCVYVLQEEAVQAVGGEHTCLHKQYMSQQVCVYVCVLCRTVTAESVLWIGTLTHSENK